MKVLLLNQDWFKDELQSLGFEVLSAGQHFAHHLDYTVEMPLLHIDRLIEQLPNQFCPDCIIIYDNSAPVTFAGFDETQIPTIYYGVDAHHHASLHRYLNDIFDYCLTAQKDYIPFYQEWAQEVEWMPLWASRYIEPSYDDKQHAAVFVGTLNQKLNPDRVAFFNALREKVDVFCATGEYWKFFPYSEIVVNQTVKLDLNFRVFEALMSGALLLTERSANGLLELFNDKEHLVTYDKNNVEHAAQLIEYYLNNPTEARRIAKAGRDRILELHTPMARAKRLAELITSVKKRTSVRKFQSMAINHLCLARTPRLQDNALKIIALTSALKSFEYVLQVGEVIDEAAAAHLIVATHDYDRLTAGRKGFLLLLRFYERFQDHRILAIATLRAALNNGERDMAKQICMQLGFDDLTPAYNESERIIRALFDAL